MEEEFDFFWWPLKNVSILDVEEAFGKAISELTGNEYTASVKRIDWKRENQSTEHGNANIQICVSPVYALTEEA